GSGGTCDARFTRTLRSPSGIPEAALWGDAMAASIFPGDSSQSSTPDAAGHWHAFCGASSSLSLQRCVEVMMTTLRLRSMVLDAASLAALASVDASSQQKPSVQIPQPGVPQIMTLEAKFVRVAYNNEGYVILGYQIANRTVGQDWIMLDVGITLMEKVKDYTLKREALTLD